MWSEVRDESWIETGFLAIPLEDPQKTISQFLADIDGGTTHQPLAEVERSMQVWRRVLDYGRSMSSVSIRLIHQTVCRVSYRAHALQIMGRVPLYRLVKGRARATAEYKPP